jgi:hypothetical protein
VPESHSRSSRLACSLVTTAAAAGGLALLLAAPLHAQDAPGGGAMVCTPGERELQTRRPLPLECRAPEAVRMTLRYRERGTSQWSTLDMTRHAPSDGASSEGGETFRAEVPWEATLNAGVLDLFVVASDRLGDPLDTLGTKNQPESFRIDGHSRVAPAFPGEDPPARCAEQVHCPPDFPGCEEGLADADRPREPGEAPPVRHWFGLHVAADVGFMGGSNVCATSNHDFDCFSSGADVPYPAPLAANVAREPGELGDVYPGTGIGTGASGGTWRILLSYDRVLSARVTAGARLGFALGGGPATPEGRNFLPLHAEGRLSYFLRDIDAGGVRPYLHLGGGIAEVDLKKSDVTVRDCSEETARDAFLACIDARDAYDSANHPELPEKKLDAYRKLGNAFVTTGGGALIALSRNTALQIHVNAMLMLPSIGLVIEPSLGMVYGF